MTKTIKATKKAAKKTSSSKNAKVKSKRTFSTYEAAYKYLCERTDYEKERHVRYNVSTFDLNRMEKLLAQLGNPQKKIPMVHIAGTKGKGSTATMLAKMLEANGYSVGLYTSPHLLHLHERIVVNSTMVTEGEMVELMNRIHAPVEKVAKTDPPSFFEIMTALAFLYFADRKVDVAVIETGLGGRLDCTNVIEPKVVGITSLSLDHTLQLGGTIEKIAAEKAGIFKKGVPIVTVAQHPAALTVLRQKALELESPLSITGKDIDFSYRFEASREYGPHTRICLTTPTSKFEHLRVPLHGTHQAINCGLALAMLDKLQNIGFKIDLEKAKQGLSEVSLAGRMEMICTDPRVMIDAAHNASSIHALVHAIGQNVPYDSLVVVFGCNRDKDIRGMMQQLQYGADKVIFTRSASARAASPHDLAEVYNEVCGKMCQTSSSLGEALLLAKNAVDKEDLICITGSFYLIGQAKARFMLKPVH
ncbi:MAG: bifunctional folylpolyglutamate synthase/dihydrofolate synthase [Phycisphaerae bacterium]|nr:bifunctional folylpolyglutamate synthase/dihydrofolate synthase [Phycisphaerae bacterium]